MTGTMYADASAEPEASQPAPPAGDEGKSKSWTDFLKWYGDFRYRLEVIDKEGSDTRHRHRIRARIGMKAKLHDSLTADFRLATGSEDPVSTNQTLGAGYATKQINLDLAYLDWHPTQLEDAAHFILGKQKNPFVKPGKTELIWDGDLSPGGGAARFSKGGDWGEFFGAISGFWVEERKSDSDTIMAGFQGGVKIKVPDTKFYFLPGVSYYHYTNLKDFPLIFDAEDSFGNSTYEDEDGVVRYLYDYRLFEFFGEVGMGLGSFPAKFVFDYVKNVASDVEEGTGWLVGFQFGKTKKPGSWKAKYDYRDVERDAVFGLASDSDFGGGGTNSKGHEFGFGYQISKHAAAGVSYFNNKLKPGTDDELQYHRFMLDLKLKF
jgi:hypothetical protein